VEPANVSPETQLKASTQTVFASQARVAAGSTAFAAALLLYFGYSSLEPARNDLGDWSLWIMFYTLRYGGLACAALTVVLFLGIAAALVVDAIVSSLIGILLILTGIGLAVGGGTMMQAAINVVCGFMFASYGIRTGLQFVEIRKTTQTPGAFENQDYEAPNPMPSQFMPLNPPAQQDFRSHSVDALRAQKAARQSDPTVDSPCTRPEPTAPPEEGFLAALAKKKSQNNDASGAA